METLAIVQYLQTKGVDLLPAMMLERNHPDWVVETPSILCLESNVRFVGLDRCVDYYREAAGADENLLREAQEWKETNPDHRTLMFNSEVLSGDGARSHMNT